VITEQVDSEEAGTVFHAEHVLLPRQVSLKIMHASTGWTRTAAMQVLREACLLEALHHPGIPRVFECGVLPDRRTWTAVERIEGDTVAQLFKAGPLSIHEVVALLRDVADVLEHAHARGVVHRQLVASAIVRTPGRMIGHAVTRWDKALTLDTKARVDIDTRDDVFALGVIAFRALTGAMPDVQTTSEALPGAPLELASLIDQLLATEPIARPTASEVRDRADWLADTLLPVVQQARWTPQVVEPPPAEEIEVRFSRKGTQ